jgi:hypothetical protein
MMGLEYENPICNPAIKDIPATAGESSAALDETFIPKGSQNPDDDGSAEASINLGGSSSLLGHLDWTLDISSQPENMVAIVDGLEREVELVKTDSNRIVGRIHVSRIEDMDVFEVVVGEDGTLSAKLLGGASLLHGDSSSADESIPMDCIKAIWTENELTGFKNISISFEDDAPWIESKGGHVIDPASAGMEHPARNLIDCGPAMDFTHGQANAKFHNDIDGLQYWMAEGVTLAPGIMQYQEDGWTPVDIIGVKDTLEGKTHWLQYSGHNSNNAKPWNWGLDVHSGAKWEHGKEISYDIVHNQGQAVIVDLNGHLAYGITVEFGACYDPNSSTMANDRQFPEAATVVFYRNGEIVGWEAATGLSKGEDQRTFGAGIADGFDRAAISVPGNHSIDPKPRNTYEHVSDNEWTVRKIDFTTHPQENPIHAYEGQVDIHPSADGWMIGDKTIGFWQEQMGDSIEVKLDDGSTHTASIAYESGGACIFGHLEDGSVLFTAVVSPDGSWKFGQYHEFTVDGEDFIPLWFKTGKDADGDYATASENVQTNGFTDVGESISIHSSIASTDGVIANADWWGVPAKVEVDTDVLGDGSDDSSWVGISITRNGETETHGLHWNGEGFECSDGFNFSWDGNAISWMQEPAEVGQLLTIEATQHWKDSTGLDREASSFASAQRGIGETPPPEPMPEPPLIGDAPLMTMASPHSTSDIPDSPAMDDHGQDTGSDMPYVSPMASSESTDLDAAAMTVMHQGG